MENSWEETLDVDDSDLRSHTLLHHRRTLDSSKLQSQTLDFTIPGPAGIFQSAKLRKTRDNVIRKGVEEDYDFKLSPWLSAIEYVNADGVFNFVRNASLGDINKHQKNGKLDQVVAVVKSCTPNQLGDLTVALKDPTGTVSGTIHHKVLTNTEFGKGICVGSVLILHKVSVFSPSRSAHYLNITTKNLVKVFMDSGTSQTQTNHGCKIIDIAFSSDSGQGTKMVRSAFSQERGVEVIMNAFRSSRNDNQGKHLDNGEENVNPVESIGQKGSNQKEILKEANEHEHEHELTEIGLKGTNKVEVHVPLWTEEQLKELFDGDMEL